MLPIINKLLAKQEPPIVENQCAQPNVVIVSPTRELAIQICEQGKKFAHNSIVKVLEVYGGTSVGYQRNRIQVRRLTDNEIHLKNMSLFYRVVVTSLLQLLAV